jgi:hypothetical protein
MARETLGMSVDNQGESNPPVRFQVTVPEDQMAGVYANGFGCWFNQTDFTLDFLVHLPQELGIDEDGSSLTIQPTRLVARVKIPPGLLFRLMQNLNNVMTQYETMFGPIPPLGEAIRPNVDGPPSSG